MNQLPLFVFGTLRRGQCNHHLLAGRYERIVPARLQDFGRIDPLMIAPRAGDVVKGDLVFLREAVYDQTLRDCDALEGIPPGATCGPWYRRTAVTVQTAEGPSPAWAYVQPE